MKGYVKYFKMDLENECPSENEITTAEECADALKWSLELGLNVVKRTGLVEGSWTYVPYGCSYQATGDHAFHWNTKYLNRVDVPSFMNGGYKMICRKGTIIHIPTIGKNDV